MLGSYLTYVPYPHRTRGTAHNYRDNAKVSLPRVLVTKVSGAATLAYVPLSLTCAALKTIDYPCLNNYLILYVGLSV